MSLAVFLAGFGFFAVFQYAPRPLKYLVYFIFMLHYRSWPLLYHFHSAKNVTILGTRYLLHRLRYAFSPAHVWKQKREEWFERLANVGMSPLDFLTTRTSFVGLDDCDYLLHLNNASYPKNMDIARLEAAIKLCPTFYRAGGLLLLGATHFRFIREIPMLSTYEMRVGIMSWDDKWLYSVTRFVSKPKSKSKSGKNETKERASLTPPTDRKSASASGSEAPTPDPAASSDAHAQPTAAQMQQLVDRPEPDGAVIHCLAISEVVCKIGRRTVPPALVFATDGYCRLEGGSTPYSHARPPPHWERVRELRRDIPALRAFLVGGWREVPAGERWWEDALGGEVEEQRVRALGCMQALRNGMEEARTV